VLLAAVFTNDASAQQRSAAERPRSAGDRQSPGTVARATVPAKQPVNSDEQAAEAESGGDEVDLNETPAGAAAPKATKRRTKATKAARPSAKAKAKDRAAGRQPSAEYVKMRDSWHAPIDPAVIASTVPVSGRPPLVLSRVLGGGGELVTLVPQRDDGGFSDEDLQRAATAWCPKETKKVHPISPRLLDLVYRAMRHFEAPLVHVVSGYRPDRAGSRHTQGRAIDFVLPGVTNEQLADYVRTFGFVGVGIYPKSGFVHLDVRDTSYYWVDNSLPDERSRAIPVDGNLAAAADRAAAARGEAPDTWVPDNEAEDRAAAKSYARRAKQRRERALRQQARASAAGAAAQSKPKSPAFSAASVLD
jgi:Bacterial protein of unknown function (DUF882)